MSNKLISILLTAAICFLAIQIAKGGHGFDLLILIVLYEAQDLIENK